MAKNRMDVTAFVGKLLEGDDSDLLREDVKVLAQALMETEVSAQIGAEPYERSSERSAYRNGTGTGPGIRGLGRSSSASPRSPAAAISRRCSSHAGGPRRRWRR